MTAKIIQRPPLYTHPALEVGNGVCTTGHPVSAQAGVRIMRKGGNAFDALVAAAFTTFVMEPESCGLGGYGHISAYVAAKQEFLSVDAYCRAPADARADMFEIDPTRPPTYYGHPYTEGSKADIGWLAIAVPGAVVGFCDTHEMLGRLPLSTVLEPAIEAAEAGVPVTFKHKLDIAREIDNIHRFPDTVAALLVDGKMPRTPGTEGEGDRLDTTNLARLLKQIARSGKKAFHRGATARRIGNYIRSNGGILSAEDIANYRPRVLREQPLTYRKHDYVACFDQVAYETLNILEHFDLKAYGPDSYAYRHLTAEALAAAFSDSMTHYGDPDFVRSPVNGLTNPAYATHRRKLLRLNKALSRPVQAGDPWPFDDSGFAPERLPDSPTLARRGGTSQVAVADAQGNVASACISIGASYGSLIFVPEVGIFMNNAMSNFDPRPEHPSHIEPGKMPIFAAPAIAATRNGEARFAASGSGGYRIEPGVLQTMINSIDFGMPVQRAVDHPRVHCQGGPTYVDARIDPAVLNRMRRAGHDLRVLVEQPGVNNFGRICAVTRNPRSGALSAGAGPAWATGVAGY
jgi:gamma-glutamyltranspeptidase/glutathione hydrolase